MLIRFFRVQIVETTDTTGEAAGPWEPLEDERPSSSRLRKAEPAPEFTELRAWTENAKRARRAS